MSKQDVVARLLWAVVLAAVCVGLAYAARLCIGGGA